MYITSDFTVEEASQYEPEMPEEPDVPGGPGGENISPVSRAEAIRMQENKIATLKLDIQESEIKIGKLEKKVNRRLVSSKLDGVVSYVGDPLTGKSEGNAFMRIKSGDGFYVVGTVGELMLEDLKEGETINCMSYQSGNFQAKVLEVSEYPIEGNSYWGSNPNVSYYSFTAEVLDKSMEFQDYDYINIALESSVPQKGSIALQKAFTRTQNGETYVYKDDNGVLKKQVLAVGPALDGGYSILVKGGITKEDKIAFPYGKDVKEGAKTREVDINEMYGY